MSDTSYVPDYEHLMDITTIGDFIPAAQHMGIVTPNVIWCRGDWPGQTYNFAFGTHKAMLAKRNVHHADIDSSYLCYANIERPKDTFDALVPAVGLCNQTQPYEEPIPVVWEVIQMDEAKRIAPKSIPKGSPYILDIDLDFFAANEPVLHQFVSFRQFGALFALIEEVVKSKTTCHNNDVVKLRKLENVMYDIYWNALTFLPGFKEGDTPVNMNLAQRTRATDLPELYKLWCNGATDAIPALVKLTQVAGFFMKNIDYVALSMLKHEYNFPTIACKVNGLFGVCSSGDPVNNDPARTTIQAQINQVGEFVTMQGPPALITIARSSDGYTPAHLLGFIETTLIKTLKRAIETHPGLPRKVTVKFTRDLKAEKPHPESKKAFVANKKEVSSLAKRVYAMKKREVEDYIKYRTTQIRNMLLVHEYMHLRGFPNIHQFLQHFKEFKKWRDELNKKTKADAKKKKVAAKPSKKEEAAKINTDKEKEAHTKPAVNYCYGIVAMSSDPTMKKLTCFVRQLRKAYDEQVHDKGERVNINFQRVKTQHHFQNFIKSEKVELSQKAQNKDDQAKFDQHSTTPLIWEEVNCKPENTKYIGGTDAFVALMQQKHKDAKFGAC